MLKVFCKNNGTYKEFQEGTTLLEMLPSFDFDKPYDIVSAKVNNVCEGLKFRVFNSRDVEFLDYRSYNGRNVYCRSLCFLLYKAAKELFPNCKIILRRPISKGFFCCMDKGNGLMLTSEDVDAISLKMREIVDMDIPFRRHEAQVSEAIKMFKKLGQEDENADEDIDLDAVVRDAEEAARDADRRAEGEKTTARPMEGQPDMVIVQRFPAAGLREISIKLDADDVTVKDSDEPDVVVKWEAENEDAIQPSMVYENHKLTIERNNPDVFKTFFSVFKKEGGKVTVCVPRGYAADYEIGTTSGDIKLYAIDVDMVKVNTTSGSVRIEPDPGIRAKEISVTSISGDATVSACAGDVSVTTVSGKQFVSCDANRASVSVVSGKAHVEGACEEWEINSVSGGIELICTVAPTNRIQLSTVSGNARVTLPSDIRGFVADMSSMSGRIVNEFGPNRYGTCALPIHMDTMSGKLMITRL